jgi:hypothetical protein
MESFLARVVKVYPTNEKAYDRVIGGIKVYNDNATFTKEDSGRLYGAISYAYQNAIVEEDYAFPFDKNNFTFPIQGETVTIIKIENETFYLPYSNPPYPNYREKVSTSISSEGTSNKSVGDNKNAATARTIVATGASYTPNTNTKEKENRGGYNVNEKIKFLNPKNGDTIISGRVGNTIRFSEFHLTEDGKTSSPGIYIRNKQNQELDSKPIGTLVEEDINKDGTSIYITSNKIKIPFKETTNKQKVAFKDFPSSDKLKGDQLFVNSDRIVLSAKASEFIIFGKGNTGVITDGRYSVDAENDIYLHTNKNVIIHSAGSNQIFLNSENGKIYLGKNQGEGQVGAPVQQMVLGGELINLFQELIIAIGAQTYLTPSGPSKVGPENFSDFTRISNRLKDILSSTNFLSK